MRFENVLETVEDKAKFFTKITAEDREKVKKWRAKQRGKTKREKNFLARVKKAVKAVNYDYWIANLEPSVINGKIYYAKGNDVGVGFSCDRWKKMSEEYSLENGSRLSNLYELFIWYALRIVNGFWTLSYVANDSSVAANYGNLPRATYSMEKTGTRKCGGFCDGQGNSYKIVTHKDGYRLIGGNYNDVGGFNYPVADVGYCNFPGITRDYGSGVLVLLK